VGGTFLAAIEPTVVAAAMPTVVTQLGGLAHYSWVFSAYLLTSTVTIPLWGQLSDLYGRRRFFLTSVGLFLLGSALSGAAQSMTQLIIFRAIQGLGAGGLLPLAMTIMGDIYTLEERGRMQGLLSATWGVASVAGPPVGGYITDLLSWRWVFYLNVPVGIPAAAAVAVALSEPRAHERPRIDYRGAILLSAAVTLLLLAVSQSGGESQTLGRSILTPLYLTVVVLGAWLFRVERRAVEPIVPLDLLTDRMVASICVSGFLTGFAMFGAISFVPLFVQAALGGTTREAGAALTSLVLGWVTMSAVTGRVVLRVGYRRMVVGGLILIAAAFLGLTETTQDVSFWWLRADLAAMGMGLGMTMLSLVLAMQAAVDRSRLGVATSFGVFTRSIGGAVGVAVMGAIIAASLPAGREATGIDMAHGLYRAFWLGMIVSVAALASATWMPGHMSSNPSRVDSRPSTVDDGE
jgi:EmrB/QacA subfamily drug resistance transporter